MKKILIFVFSLFMLVAPYDLSAAVKKPPHKKILVRKKHVVPKAVGKTRVKKAAPISSEKQLRGILVSQLSRIFSRNEVEEILKDPRIFLDRSIFQAGISSCPGGFFDPNCGILIRASLKRGKDFITAHQEVFDKASEEYGVEQETVAAILRVETNFGSYLGKRSVLNTLYTLYVLSPRHRNFALEQLEFFIRLAKANEWDFFEIKGSTSGALGLPQFIPFSYWHYAVDGNGDGKIDLFNADDAICSTANYLAQHGWSDNAKNQASAIWAYNHDTAYVNAVLAYAKSLKNLQDDDKNKENGDH